MKVLNIYATEEHYKLCILEYLLENNREHEPLILDKTCWGIKGVIYYICPLFMFHALYKEIYRLEVNVRGLEKEKIQNTTM